MDRLIVIIGPTAIGKTRVSIDLAKVLNTEIVSGDSMLVYKGLNIGTAKPTLAERSGIKHYMIDILDPAEEFSVVDFQELAGKYIAEINNRGKIPILAGGTGLYVKALLEGYKFNTASGSPEIRAKFEGLAEKFGNTYIHNLLGQVDPVNASRLHPNDLRRVIRALEVYNISGKAFQQEKDQVSDKILLYDAIVIGLTMNRELLYQRINQRVDMMMEQGLVREVEQLIANGISPTSQAMQGIGYKEVVSYLRGEFNLATVVSKIKQSTRHFAKRQLTWYRKMNYITWFDVSDFSSYDNMLESIYSKIAGKFTLKSK